jgi:hypothetical protein
MAEWSKEFLTEFVGLYWALESSWNVKSEGYSDRVSKDTNLAHL